MGKKVERYSDIINLPHHQSVRRPHMTNYNRAAQFAPFSALVGYETLLHKVIDMRLNEKGGEDFPEIGLDQKRRINCENVLNIPGETLKI